jgi:hypothetical protein
MWVWRVRAEPRKTEGPATMRLPGRSVFGILRQVWRATLSNSPSLVGSHCGAFQ